MDVPWGDPRMWQFATTVGIITSDGPHGRNAMAAEWTRQASYSPGLIEVNVGHGKATAQNIIASRRFGVSLAAQGQGVAASIAGGMSGREVDKIAVMKKMGFEFYEGKETGLPMLLGAAVNAECVLVKSEALGDHTLFVGEITSLSADLSKKPLLYHQGQYWGLGGKVKKPPASITEEIRELKEKYRRNKAGGGHLGAIPYAHNQQKHNGDKNGRLLDN